MRDSAVVPDERSSVPASLPVEVREDFSAKRTGCSATFFEIQLTNLFFVGFTGHDDQRKPSFSREQLVPKLNPILDRPILVIASAPRMNGDQDGPGNPLKKSARKFPVRR